MSDLISVRPSVRSKLWAQALAVVLIATAAQAHAASGGKTVATVEGEIITLDEVENSLSAKLAALTEQIYQLKRQGLDALIAEKLLAKEAQQRGMTVDALLDSEVVSRVPMITPGEIEAFYQTNESRLPTHDPAIRERIRAHLYNQKLLAHKEAFVGQLRNKFDVKTFLDAPPAYRAPLTIDSAPFKGAVDAPIVIVKFEDFHCPFCKESQRTLEELLGRYPGKIKVVHKDFPIDDLHPGARQAHWAARCAGEQGKFWPYHDELYRNAPRTAPADLKKYAEVTGLNADAFEACLSGKKFAAAVQADIDEGVRAGVTGTPAFFVNGRLIPGAQPLERFVAVIDEEIARRR